MGAAILADDGVFISGANVENASYPVGTCAERCAGVKAVVSSYISFFFPFWNGFLYRSLGVRDRSLYINSVILGDYSRMIVQRIRELIDHQTITP